MCKRLSEYHADACRRRADMRARGEPFELIADSLLFQQGLHLADVIDESVAAALREMIT